MLFDDADTALPPDRAPDLRVLDEAPADREVRRDLLTGEWISDQRRRGGDHQVGHAVGRGWTRWRPQMTYGNPSEIPSDYDVAVFENRSPGVRPGAARAGLARGRPGAPRRRQPGGRGEAFGRCEVVSFSSPSEGGLRLGEPIPGAHGHRGLGRPDRLPVIAARHRARCTSSRTAAPRSASPCSTRTGRSTRTRTSRRAPASSSSQIDAYGPSGFADILEDRDGRAAGAAGRRALDRVRPPRRPLARRGAPAAPTSASPTWRGNNPRRSATSSRSSTCGCCAASTRSARGPAVHRRLAPGARAVAPRQCTAAPAADVAAAQRRHTFKCPGGGRRPGWAPGSAISRRRPRPSGCARRSPGRDEVNPV